MLALARCARFGPFVRGIGAALTVVMLAAGCAGGSGDPSGGAGPAGSPTAVSGCGRDDAMSRPCPEGAPKASQMHRPLYKSDRGYEFEQYNGDVYHGQSAESCKPRLKESFPAYKACLRY